MNKIGILFFALSTMGIGTLSAQTADSTQTSPWTKEGFAGLKLTQVSLTNWAAGGEEFYFLLCKFLSSKESMTRNSPIMRKVKEII
jgi:hypothetical protein